MLSSILTPELSSSLFCKQGKHYRGAFDWSYFRKRIPHVNISLLISSTVIFRPFKLYVDQEYFILSRFLGIAVLWVPKQAKPRVHFTYSYSGVLSIKHAFGCPLIPDNDALNNQLLLWKLLVFIAHNLPGLILILLFLDISATGRNKPAWAWPEWKQSWSGKLEWESIWGCEWKGRRTLLK